MTPSPLKGTIMLRNLVTFVATVILVFFYAYILDPIIANFKQMLDEKRWDKEYEEIRKQRESTT